MVTTSISDYWISSTAISISLNAMGNYDYAQVGIAPNASIVVYIKGVIDYDNSHKCKSWKLTGAPTAFGDSEPKYVYVAIPRSSTAENQNAIVVFPSELIDLHGKNDAGEQVGLISHYYIYLQGIISASIVGGVDTARKFTQDVQSGKLMSDDALMNKTDSEWYTFSPVTGRVSFLKEIIMETTSKFLNLMADVIEASSAKLNSLALAGTTLDGVANDTTAVDNNSKVVTPKAGQMYFLSKQNDDTAKGNLIFEGTLDVFGNFVSKSDAFFGGDIKVEGKVDVDKNATVKGNIVSKEGYIGSEAFAPDLLGYGWHIDKQGNGTMDSLFLRKFLEVPELRFNRVSVHTGVQWQTFGAGIIEEVMVISDTTGMIKLKLEDGESGAVASSDLCMGIWHNEDGSKNETQTEDSHNGNFTFAGFTTVYFRIVAICDNVGDETYPDSRNQYFKYELRPVSHSWSKQMHPQMGMTFACYANDDIDKVDRKSSIYSTTSYAMMLVNMTTWEYDGNNINLIEGKLDGFSIPAERYNSQSKQWETYQKQLEGSGIAFGRAYMWGTIEQFNRARYIVSQRPYYLTANYTPEQVSSMWSSGQLTPSDFGTTAVAPTQEAPYMYSLIRYEYNTEDYDYSEPSCSAVYSGGKDGKPGADAVQPNLYGYDTIFQNEYAVKNALHTYNGLAAYVNKTSGLAYYINLKFPKPFKANVRYAISGEIMVPAIATYNRVQIIQINGSDVASKITLTLPLTTANVYTPFVLTFTPGEDLNGIRFGFTNGLPTTVAGLMVIRNLKVEDASTISGDSTPFVSLEEDSISTSPNLLPYSSTLEGWEQLDKTGTEVIEKGFQGNSVVHYIGGARIDSLAWGSANILMHSLVDQLQPGVIYTLSWWQKGSGVCSVYFPSGGKSQSPVLIDCKDVRMSDINLTSEHELDSNWTRHSVTFRTADSIPSSAHVRFVFEKASNVEGNEIYLSTLKLEECEKPTDWQVRAEDLQGPQGPQGPQGEQGSPGNPGLQGCVLRICGEWDKNAMYVNESDVEKSGIRYIDVVQHEESDGNIKYYQLKPGVVYVVGKEPPMSQYWEAANMFDFVATKVLMSKEAWIEMLTGKKFLAQDDKGQITAGLQSLETTEDASVTPQIFAGASQNNAANAPFRVMSDGSVFAENMTAQGHIESTSVQAYGSNGCRVSIEDGKVSFFGAFNFPNIEMGLDSNGCAILQFYDKDGLLQYNLGPEGILKNFDIVESKFISSALSTSDVNMNMDISNRGNALSICQAEVTSRYQFIEGYKIIRTSGQDVKRYLVSDSQTSPSSYDKRYYISDSKSSNAENWHPTGGYLDNGFYIGKEIAYSNSSGFVYYGRFVYYVSNTDMERVGTFYYKVANYVASFYNSDGIQLRILDTTTLAQLLDMSGGFGGTLPMDVE